MKFGRYLFKLRRQSGLSLREFSKLSGYDSSNLSKLERDILPPPSERTTLVKWATILGLDKESGEVEVFVDMAAIARRQIPTDIIMDEDVLAFVPAFLRTIGNAKPTREQLERVIAILREANKGEL